MAKTVMGNKAKGDFQNENINSIACCVLCYLYSLYFFVLVSHLGG